MRSHGVSALVASGAVAALAGLLGYNMGSARAAAVAEAAARTRTAAIEQEDQLVFRGEELEYHVQGLRLAARAWGPRDSERRIFLMHGWLDNANTFVRLAPLLAVQGFRLVAIDFPGHGHSAHIPKGSRPYTPMDYIGICVELLTQMGWVAEGKHFSLVGHSMGGCVALMVAPMVRGHVDAVVSIDAVGVETSKEAQACEIMREGLRVAAHLNSKTPRVYSSLKQAADKLRENSARLNIDGETLSVEASLALTSRGTRALPGRGVVFRHDIRHRGRGSMRPTEAQLLSFFREVECDVLIIEGNQGLIPFLKSRFGDEALNRRLECFRKLQYEVVDGSHHLHLDNAEAVATTILAFLGRVCAHGASTSDTEESEDLGKE